MQIHRTPWMQYADQNHVDAVLKSVPLALDWIKLDPNKPRRPDDHSIQALANAIEYCGLLHPILVKKLGPKPEYQIESGERRYLACRRLGWREMPGIDVTASDKAGIGLIENLQREDLSAVAEARCLSRFKEETGFKDDELGRLLNRSRTAVTQTLGIIRLPATILDEAECLQPRPTRDLLITLSQCRTHEQQLLAWNFIKQGRTRAFLRRFMHHEQPGAGFLSVTRAAGRVIRLLKKVMEQQTKTDLNELDRLKQIIATINALLEVIAHADGTSAGGHAGNKD